MNNRLIARLEQARNQSRGVLIPYLTGGYPDLQTTSALLKRLDRAGCQAIEVGFPFSDSIADGPVIQDSFYRALENGFKIEALFNEIAAIRSDITAAMVAMVSMSIVARVGLEEFVERAAKSGFDGLIVPDVPVNECERLAITAQKSDLCNILMAAPTTSQRRREQIAKKSTGFIYLIAAKGITGERKGLSDEVFANVESIKAQTKTPVMVGFGIHTADQVRQVCQVAGGAIVGSAIVRRITKAAGDGKDRDELVDSVGRYVQELMNATA